MDDTAESLTDLFGGIDVYLFDQMLRGRLTARMRVLDAGCGAGRNAHYLLRQGARLHGVDRDPGQIAAIRALAATLAPGLPQDHFRVAELSDLPFADGCFDFIICSAVLHFADDERHFEAMVAELWRVLAPRGVWFARLASTIGVERHVTPSHGRWHALPDGTRRFLVDEAYLLRVEAALGGERIDPLKTTNVQNLRAMTTWVMRKPEPA